MPKKAKHEIVCIAQFTAKRGKEAELLRSLHKLMKPTHQEEGCVRYELNQQTDNPRLITYVEKWANMKIFKKHCKMPYIVDFFDNVAPKLIAAQTIGLHKEILP